MKLLRSIWAWLKRIFSFEEVLDYKPVETDTNPEIKTDKSKEETPVNPVNTDVPNTVEDTTNEPEITVTPTPKGIGFDQRFLPVPVPLPVVDRAADSLLHYKHFSIAMNPERRMPYYTAVNIDAEKYNKLKDQIPSRKEIGDNWVKEPRIPDTAQLPESFYKFNDFDLGHMVRREDALWGNTLEEALAANNDTFYLTNAVPQHKDFNRNAQRWKGLEDYALKNARKNDLKVSVFSGCVFDENDRKFEGVQIPGQFFKILVMVKQNGELSATGYMIKQDDLIKDITERKVGFQYEQFKTYQVPISQIEEVTGLQFGLNEHDPLQKTRDVFVQPAAIDDYEDIVF